MNTETLSTFVADVGPPRTMPGIWLMDYLAQLAAVLGGVPHDSLSRAVDILMEAQEHGRAVYLIGNGGSAATASHLAADLAKTARVPSRRPIKAFALTDNTSLVTAWANDLAYEQIFAQQLEGLCEPSDVVIVISASGNSPNIVEGLRAAIHHGARTIALVGFDGGRASELAEVAIHVNCADYGLVEDTHSAIGHAIASTVRRLLEPLPPT